MILLVLLGVVVVGFALFVFFAFSVNSAVDRGHKRSQDNAEQILDAAFDGRDDVTFTINMQSVKYETVIVGAKKRGYKLTHQADGPHGPQTLIFEKTSVVDADSREDPGT